MCGLLLKGGGGRETGLTKYISESMSRGAGGGKIFFAKGCIQNRKFILGKGPLSCG